MIIWAFIVFVFGLTVFLFDLFEIFAWFAPWIWSIILFVIALGMLNRIWRKEKEKLASMVAELEDKLKQKKS